MRLSRFTTPYQRLVIGWIIKFTFYKALIIVNYLRKAKCQLSILGRYQIQPYGKTRSIIASTILRWGTQVNLLTSVADSKSALRSYVDDADARFPPRRNGTPNCIKEYILDVQFRTDLDELITILRPIHEHQRMSESEDATIDKVYTRWFDIKLHLNAQTRAHGTKEWIEEEMLLAEDMHLDAEEAERREQNLLVGGEEEGEEDGEDAEDEEDLMENEPLVTQNLAPVERNEDLVI